MEIFDDRRCELGEGALWHPGRQQLFWFDILGGALLSRDGDEARRWDLGELASAAGWIDRDHLLVATETGLWRFGLLDGAKEPIAAIAADAPQLRSNDGRADPWGGFWIGTMAKAGKAPGSIWRYWKGELRELYPGIATPNAICFDAGRELGYFADTPLGKVWAQPLDPATGWPKGEPRLFLEDKSPDGAVVDAEGRIWIARWGGGRVTCHAPDGRLVGEERFPAGQLTCPAFGGADLGTLYVTSAQAGMSEDARQAEPASGMTFARDIAARGLPEPAVLLG